MSNKTDYTTIKLTHANLNKEVSIRLGGLAMYHHSDTAKATYVYTIAGVVPVNESTEEITSMINNLTKGESNE